MQQSDDPIHLGPLARGWRHWQGNLIENGLTDDQIDICRMMFYAGADCAAQAATQDPLAALVMTIEVHRFNHRRRQKEASNVVQLVFRNRR
jgi:hypothetical protein